MAAGFTMVELVVVIVLIGILSVVAVPRLTGQQAYEELGFFDETRGILRYAQKTAVAKRRLVCVAFTANGVSLTFASAAGAAVCDTPLAGPSGETPCQIVARSAGSSYAPLPGNFTFDPLGRPSTGQVITIAGNPRTITVEAETGYVH